MRFRCPSAVASRHSGLVGRGFSTCVRSACAEKTYSLTFPRFRVALLDASSSSSTGNIWRGGPRDDTWRDGPRCARDSETDKAALAGAVLI